MAKKLSRIAAEALAAADWNRIDAMTDADIARQIAANPEAAPDMAPEIDVRAIRRATGMTQDEFAAAYQFSVRTVQQWERGAKRPSGPARTLLRAIKARSRGSAAGAGGGLERLIYNACPKRSSCEVARGKGEARGLCQPALSSARLTVSGASSMTVK